MADDGEYAFRGVELQPIQPGATTLVNVYDGTRSGVPVIQEGPDTILINLTRDTGKVCCTFMCCGRSRKITTTKILNYVKICLIVVILAADLYKIYKDAESRGGWRSIRPKDFYRVGYLIVGALLSPKFDGGLAGLTGQPG